ncbi:hypothetical protein K1T71_003773 [Dendrolimus kikuchii]|uniref:Uncharacterized protein n=1 Tax=Dendrolimus kikuchii TaxID=765133 RepID=A0ACC1D9D0_9NEOP|nr:hypothetical protein K1T71_003773 [Dendrolimus kikuchii]
MEGGGSLEPRTKREVCTTIGKNSDGLCAKKYNPTSSNDAVAFSLAATLCPLYTLGHDIEPMCICPLDLFFSNCSLAASTDRLIIQYGLIKTIDNKKLHIVVTDGRPFWQRRVVQDFKKNSRGGLDSQLDPVGGAGIGNLFKLKAMFNNWQLFFNPNIDNANSFIKKYDRKYAHEKEVSMRKAIFKQNIRLVKETNRRNLGYKLTINHFADRTPEEMKKYRGLHRRPEGKIGTIPFPYTESRLKEVASDLPVEYDARIYGLVSTVKNQEECGSCWTFGTTAAAEGALAKSNGGKLITLANQALVDCAWPFGAAGCDGGTDNAAYEWMQEYGLPTEAEYGPYANRDGFCHIKNMTKTYPIKGFTDVTPNSIGALKVALVNHGPLSVSIDADPISFNLYSSGIYYESTCDPRSLNHEVTLVGYGEKDGETFWIIRNSWGPQWGIDGYMHISSRENACGITTEPTYVVF